MEPAEDHEHVFSNGLYLANFTMSSSILMDSWKAIPEAPEENLVINKAHPDYNIIAIASLPGIKSYLQGLRRLVTITEIPEFAFLRSNTVQSLSINEAALFLFRILREKLGQRQEEVEASSVQEASPSLTNTNKKKEPICYIITGCGLDGSVASLFTLSLLNTLNPTEFRLLCITFGSPLLGDAHFQQAISHHSTWNSCFLHVVQTGDSVPRSYLDLPHPSQTPYQPFGRFVFCSESGGASFQAPESVIKLLIYENPQAVAENHESQTLKYKEVIKCLEEMHSRSNVSSFLGFGNGLYLANFAVSSNLLTDSWNAISKHQGHGPITIIDDHSAYNIIAFVSSPVTTSNLEQESCLVPVLEISDFQFLCSDTHPSFNEAAVSLFNSLRGKLSQLLSELQEKFKTSSEPDASSSSAENNKRPIPYIITGRGLNGSVASLFTLLLLNTLDPTKFKLRCITFGSPFLGDTAFQQAVLRHPTWNSCFLHVVHKGDCVPRLSLVLPYKPFGTFLLCSESGDAYFQAPEPVIEWLKCENAEAVAENQKSGTFDYKNVLERVEKKLLERDFEAGITGQVAAVGLWQRQQNEGISALIESIIKHEQDIIKRQREEFDPDKELEEMKVYMTFLEWYINICRANDQGPGYYDSFKSSRERRDNGVDKYKTYLTDYWEKVVDHVEKKPQRPHAPLRTRFLYAGTNYRRIVEPLDIAEYYRRGRKDYLTRGRSKHYERLEKWLEEYPNSEDRKKGKETEDGPSKSEVVNVTEDSCFWARVEDAIRSCRLPDRDRAASSDGSEDFENYVMGLIEKKKVSKDIFFEKSSYMQWWREYEISNKVKEGSDSHPSILVDFMKRRRYENYVKGSPTDSNENPSDTSHSGPSTSGDHRG